jgi:DNA-binding CsgD family transcriptional regulator
MRDPLLVVSVLDGTIDHDSVRRRLRTALSALDRAEERGAALPDAAGTSGSAGRTPWRLAERIEMRARGFAGRISDWHAGAAATVVIGADGDTLVIETGGDSTPLLGERSGVSSLTARERDVMRCVEEGLSNIEIAHRLWIEPATVRKHLEHIFAKLGVRNRTAAVSKIHAIVARAD